jgi:hypothetical protein
LGHDINPAQKVPSFSQKNQPFSGREILFWPDILGPDSFSRRGAVKIDPGALGKYFPAKMFSHVVPENIFPRKKIFPEKKFSRKKIFLKKFLCQKKNFFHKKIFSRKKFFPEIFFPEKKFSGT